MIKLLNRNQYMQVFPRVQFLNHCFLWFTLMIFVVIYQLILNPSLMILIFFSIVNHANESLGKSKKWSIYYQVTGLKFCKKNTNSVAPCFNIWHNSPIIKTRHQKHLRLVLHEKLIFKELLEEKRPNIYKDSCS